MLLAPVRVVALARALLRRRAARPPALHAARTMASAAAAPPLPPSGAPPPAAKPKKGAFTAEALYAYPAGTTPPVRARKALRRVRALCVVPLTMPALAAPAGAGGYRCQPR
jgi:hypothetical protein